MNVQSKNPLNAVVASVAYVALIGCVATVSLTVFVPWIA